MKMTAYSNGAKFVILHELFNLRYQLKNISRLSNVSKNDNLTIMYGENDFQFLWGCGKIILKAVLVVASESNKGQKIRDSGDKYTGKD